MTNDGDEEKRFRITYWVKHHPDGVPKSEVHPDERGGTVTSIPAS